MTRIKDMIIIPFRSCRKSTTAAVLGAARKGHAAAAAPIVAASDDDERGRRGVRAAHRPEDAPALRILRREDRARRDGHPRCARGDSQRRRIADPLCYLSPHRTRSDRRAGVEKVATDVGASRVTVTGTADAAAVATSVQIRTRRPITVVRGGRSGAQERSAAAPETPREEDQLVRARGRSTAAQLRPVPERTAARQSEEDEIAGRQERQEQVGSDAHAASMTSILEQDCPGAEQKGWSFASAGVAGRPHSRRPSGRRRSGCGYCGRCISRIVQSVSRFQGVREIKLMLPDPATTRCRRSSSSVCDNRRMNQQHTWDKLQVFMFLTSKHCMIATPSFVTHVHISAGTVPSTNI
ncbi:hypothetical protein C2845_PM02G13940 [Panicum miliaceum]|uniref:Uncharacterized protein n=1 Tax=Panicum miliaceum TaxID=4540 RepID=A0A3L6SD54_PANMI|nr:hypothetical protein C2845_PM02G13940 [Panicum miliaceum]